VRRYLLGEGGFLGEGQDSVDEEEFTPGPDGIANAAAVEVHHIGMLGRFSVRVHRLRRCVYLSHSRLFSADIFRYSRCIRIQHLRAYLLFPKFIG